MSPVIQEFEITLATPAVAGVILFDPGQRGARYKVRASVGSGLMFAALRNDGAWLGRSRMRLMEAGHASRDALREASPMKIKQPLPQPPVAWIFSLGPGWELACA